MGPRIVGISAVAFVLVAVGACLGNESGYSPNGGSDGSVACAKMCNAACADPTDPATGCASADCTACPAPNHTKAACGADGACTVSGCADGFGDCNSNVGDGCETALSSDATNCGTCGNACGGSNTTTPPRCAAGKCAFSCEANFLHCASSDSAGCETLESSANCGTCGHACGGADCTAGVCNTIPIATNQNAPMGISIDTGSIYWAENTAAAIRRAGLSDAVCNGAACTMIANTMSATYRTLTPDGKSYPTATASNGTTLYFTCNDTNAGALSVPVGGGTVVLSGGGSGTSFALAIDANHVFYTNRTGSAGVSVWDGSNIHDPSDGADDSNATTPGSDAIAIDSGRIYFADATQGVIFERDEGDFFVASSAIYNAPCDMTPSGVAPLCTNITAASDVQHLVASSGYLYWSEAGNKAIRRLKLLDRTITTLATNQAVTVLAVDSAHIYWGNADDNSFRSAGIADAPCDGAACTVIVPSGVGTGPSGLAVDSSFIYVSFAQTSGAGTGLVAKRVK